MDPNERFWSMVAPMYFTDSLASIGWPLQETRSLDWGFNLCFEPNKTVSVFPKCKDNLLLISQSLTVSIQNKVKILPHEFVYHERKNKILNHMHTVIACVWPQQADSWHKLKTKGGLNWGTPQTILV